MRDCYRINKLLGTGAYGEVRECVYKKDMKDKRTSIKSYRAVKIMSKAYMEPKDVQSFKNEVECMWSLNHPSIMKMHGFYEDNKRYLLIQDICAGGELLDYIQANGKLQPNDAAVIIKQLLSAVSEMHTNKIVHRDLKPENILLEREGDLQDIKLIDFGTAKRWNQDIKKNDDGEDETQIHEKVGTILYLAPEVMKASKEEGYSYNELCDMWSIGVIAYILCTGQQPFQNQDDK